MDIAAIRALVDLVIESGIAELEVKQEGLQVKIRRHGSPALAGGGADRAATIPTTASNDSSARHDGAVTPLMSDAVGRAVTSPIVGIFLSAPEPGTPNFVGVGQRVAVGDTLCIIEAMKVLNEIEAEFAGIVREICVQNGQPVEAEGLLFRIEPA